MKLLTPVLSCGSRKTKFPHLPQSGALECPSGAENPQFYVIAASYTAFLWCGFTVNSFAVPHIMDKGFSETVAATLLSTMAFINAFSRLAGGAIGEWLEPKNC